MSQCSMFLLSSLESLYFFIEVLYLSTSVLFVPLIHINFWLRQLFKYLVLFLLYCCYLFSLLSIYGQFNFITSSNMWRHFISVAFNQIIFIPNHLWFYISLFSVNGLFILSFYSLLALSLMCFHVVFYSFHYYLLIKAFFSFS